MSSMNDSCLGKRIATYFPQSTRLRRDMVLFSAVCALGTWTASISLLSTPNRVLQCASILLVGFGVIGLFRVWRRQSRRVHLHQKGIALVQTGAIATHLWQDVSDVWQVPVHRTTSGDNGMQTKWSVRLQTLDGRKLKLDGFEGANSIAQRAQEALANRCWNHYRQAYESGSWVRFGKKLAISNEGLNIGLKAFHWYEISEIFLDEEDGVRIALCNESIKWVHVPISSVSNFHLLSQLLTWIKTNQSLNMEDERIANEHRSIGLFELPSECDASELAASGYEWDEIDDVLNGHCSIDELLQRGPRKRPRVPK